MLNEFDIACIDLVNKEHPVKYAKDLLSIKAKEVLNSIEEEELRYDEIADILKTISDVQEEFKFSYSAEIIDRIKLLTKNFEIEEYQKLGVKFSNPELHESHKKERHWVLKTNIGSFNLNSIALQEAIECIKCIATSSGVKFGDISISYKDEKGKQNGTI